MTESKKSLSLAAPTAKPFDRVELRRKPEHNFYYNEDWAVSLCKDHLEKFGVTALHVSILVSRTKRKGWWTLQLRRSSNHVEVKSLHFTGTLLFEASQWLIKRRYLAGDDAQSTIYVKFINHHEEEEHDINPTP